MKKIKKMSIWMIPVLIVIVLFLLIGLKHLNGEHQLPAKGWSRTVKLPIYSAGEPYSYTDDKGSHLFTFNGSKMTLTDFNSTLDITHQDHFTVKGTIDHVIWGQGKRFVYKQDGNLFLFNKGKTSEIDKTVNQTAYDDHHVFYTKKANLFRYDLKTKKTAKIGTFPSEITSLDVSGPDHKIILTSQKGNQNVNFYLVSGNGPVEGTPQPFARAPVINNATISSIQETFTGGDLSVYYSMTLIQQGIQHYNYFFKMPVEKINKGKSVDLKNDPMRIFLKKSGAEVNKPGYFFLTQKDGKTLLLFSASGLRNLRDTALNIYAAQQNNKGKWIAERRSTSIEPSEYPFVLGKDAIGWLDYESQDHFRIAAASQNPKVIDSSMDFTSQDFSMAFSGAAISLFRIFMFLLLAIVYATPTIFVYAIISFTKVELIERGSQVLKFVLMFIVALFQFLLILHLFTPKFIFYAPAYLTFPSAVYIVPIILTAFTWWVTRLVKTPDWSMVSEVMYFALIFLLTSIFLYGPYVF